MTAARDGTHVLLDAIDELDRLHGALERIASRTDEKRKRELVALRRALADQIARVGAAAGGCAALAGASEQARAFRERFSAMRTAVALHQANWPAVAIDTGGDAYTRSAMGVRTSNRSFVDWTRAALSTP